MAYSSLPSNHADNWFNHDSLAPFEINRRKCVRYIRNDIGATIRKIRLLNIIFITNHDISVKLVDISSRGVLISTDMRLATNKKILLTIRFADFKEFYVPGKVVRKAVVGDSRPSYGVKFDRSNDDLADYLLITQRKLTFK